ncbi:anucleate primary sterigmata (ApsB) [Pseudohyphozyma bogoriensis]|nr:anucleate primary sterigmata (ApsB) [Pseudohyphozyma bogoriensis]
MSSKRPSTPTPLEQHYYTTPSTSDSGSEAPAMFKKRSKKSNLRSTSYLSSPTPGSSCMSRSSSTDSSLSLSDSLASTSTAATSDSELESASPAKEAVYQSSQEQYYYRLFLAIQKQNAGLASQVVELKRKVEDKDDEIESLKSQKRKILRAYTPFTEDSKVLLYAELHVSLVGTLWVELDECYSRNKYDYRFQPLVWPWKTYADLQDHLFFAYPRILKHKALPDDQLLAFAFRQLTTDPNPVRARTFKALFHCAYGSIKWRRSGGCKGRNPIAHVQKLVTKEVLREQPGSAGVAATDLNDLGNYMQTRIISRDSRKPFAYDTPALDADTYGTVNQFRPHVTEAFRKACGEDFSPTRTVASDDEDEA